MWWEWKVLQQNNGYIVFIYSPTHYFNCDYGDLKLHHSRFTQTNCWYNQLMWVMRYGLVRTLDKLMASSHELVLHALDLHILYDLQCSYSCIIIFTVFVVLRNRGWAQHNPTKPACKVRGVSLYKLLSRVLCFKCGTRGFPNSGHIIRIC